MSTKIEWTGETWNPIVGCFIISLECIECYAMKDAWRKNHNPLTPHSHGVTHKVNGNSVWTGKVTLASEAGQALKHSLVINFTMR